MLLNAGTSTLIFISSMIARQEAAASAIGTLRSPTPKAPAKNFRSRWRRSGGASAAKLAVLIDPRAYVLVSDVVELWQYRRCHPIAASPTGPIEVI